MVSASWDPVQEQVLKNATWYINGPRLCDSSVTQTGMQAFRRQVVGLWTVGARYQMSIYQTTVLGEGTMENVVCAH